MLAIWGMCICSIWAPLWLKIWRRQNKELNTLWSSDLGNAIAHAQPHPYISKGRWTKSTLCIHLLFISGDGVVKDIDYPNPDYDRFQGVCGGRLEMGCTMNSLTVKWFVIVSHTQGWCGLCHQCGGRRSELICWRVSISSIFRNVW